MELKTVRDSIRLQWVLQKEAVSSRCHRWRKSTVTPSRASHPSVGEGIKRLARPHFHCSSLLFLRSAAVLCLRKLLTGTFFQLLLHEHRMISLHFTIPHDVSWWIHYTVTLIMSSFSHTVNQRTLLIKHIRTICLFLLKLNKLRWLHVFIQRVLSLKRSSDSV